MALHTCAILFGVWSVARYPCKGEQISFVSKWDILKFSVFNRVFGILD